MRDHELARRHFEQDAIVAHSNFALVSSLQRLTEAPVKRRVSHGLEFFDDSLLCLPVQRLQVFRGGVGKLYRERQLLLNLFEIEQLPLFPFLSGSREDLAYILGMIRKV